MLKKTSFWDTAPRSFAQVDQDFRGAMSKLTAHPDEEGSAHSETSVYFNGTTRRYIQECCSIHIYRPENLKSHYYVVYNEMFIKFLEN
jgi:hypothetical protein